VPIFAFLVGVLLSAHIKSGRAHKLVSHPLWWTMGVQAVAFAVVGFVPISFLAAMQFTLFRSIGHDGQPDAIRRVRYSVYVDKDDGARPSRAVLSSVRLPLYIGGSAVRFPAALLAITVVFFIVDERGKKNPDAWLRRC